MKAQSGPRAGGLFARIRRRLGAIAAAPGGEAPIDPEYGSIQRSLTLVNGKNPNRGLMLRMMGHFGLEPRQAVAELREDIEQADRNCVHCGQLKRCRNWFVWGHRNDAPRIFCPNAARFDELAANARDGKGKAGS